MRSRIRYPAFLVQDDSHLVMLAQFLINVFRSFKLTSLHENFSRLHFPPGANEHIACRAEIPTSRKGFSSLQVLTHLCIDFSGLNEISPLHIEPCGILLISACVRIGSMELRRTC